MCKKYILAQPTPGPILNGSSLKANQLLQFYWVFTATHDWLQWTEEWKICTGFFDLFDSVPYRQLVTKLQQMGVPDHVLVWISGYLTCRSQRLWSKVQHRKVCLYYQESCKGESLALSSFSYTSTSSDTQTVLYEDDLLFHPISRQQDLTTLQWDIMVTEQCYLRRDFQSLVYIH